MIQIQLGRQAKKASYAESLQLVLNVAYIWSTSSASWSTALQITKRVEVYHSQGVYNVDKERQAGGKFATLPNSPYNFLIWIDFVFQKREGVINKFLHK